MIPKLLQDVRSPETETLVSAVSLCVVALVLLAPFAGIATAKQTTQPVTENVELETDVDVIVDADSVHAGETVRVEVVATAPENGVGAANLSLSLDGTDASFVNASLPIDPRTDDVQISDDGRSIAVSYFGAATTASEDTVLLSVGLDVHSAGELTVAPTTVEVSDEVGHSYAVETSESRSLSVSAAPTDTPTSTTEPTSDGTDAASTTEMAETATTEEESGTGSTPGFTPVLGVGAVALFVIASWRSSRG